MISHRGDLSDDTNWFSSGIREEIAICINVNWRLNVAQDVNLNHNMIAVLSNI